MKQLATLILLCSTSLFLSAGGIEFFHGTFEEAKALAKEQEKLLFVDAYAQWCGPCKRMARDVFTQEEVGAFYNATFINVKMDMENGEGPQFAQKYPVSAYPTLMYIDYDGKLVHKQKGAQQAEGLIQLGKMALRKIDRSGDYAKEYENGNRMPQLVYDYMKALNQAGKPSLKIANDYLRTQEDLTTPFNLQFILEATLSVDSKPYSYLDEYATQIGAAYGRDKFQDRVFLAATNTAKKAVRFETKALLDEAQAAVRKHAPARYATFKARTDLDFYRSGNDQKAYFKACDAFVAAMADQRPKEVNRLAQEISSQHGDDAKCLKKAAAYARTAAETNTRYDFYLTYAQILQRQGKQKEAIAAAETAVSMAEQQDARTAAAAKRFLQQLREG